MPLIEKKYVCPLSGKIFFDPVILLGCKHTFEEEPLRDELNKKSNCPDCGISIKNESQIHPDENLKKEIVTAIQAGVLPASEQYLPRYLLFNLLANKKLSSMPLAQIETILKNEYQEIKKNDIKDLNALFLDPFKPKKEKLIVCALNTQPQRMAYFLRESIKESMLAHIVKKLLDIGAFNETTINQAISEKVIHQEQFYSVSYLLLSNVEGRTILKENPALRRLIGEKLAEEYIQQFLCPNRHEGTLYYLLSDEVGRGIVVQYSSLQEKIKKLDKTVLTRTIVNGPNQGKTLESFYKELFPDAASSGLTFSR